ncbi:hypothetical protein LOAG_09794 [Loa loa]|uniref:C3H1-type domain-containing protein n=1 Tax=Loa loa TaxID=7209 RepID=A0A1S0TQZ6_LOALO|nr:hypothetical protein LOAG_09794 [Loa loa]EFO18701.2 hypothetical protein LOAG_09794 [Loa loa]
MQIFSAISLLEARIRACSPNNGVLVASTTDVCRLEILANAHFLSSIKIAKLIKATNGKEPSIPYPNASTDIATLQATIGNSLNAATSPLTVPYPVISPLTFMQQLAFPFRFDITSATVAHSDTSAAAAAAAAAVYNIAAAANVTTHTAMLQHATPTATFDPYVATQMAAAASQLLQEQHQFQQQIAQQLQVNNCNVNNTINGYHQNQSNEVEEDSKSHKEVKIEVFSEDEDDYGGEENDICVLNENGNRDSWEMECSKNLNENTNLIMDHQSYGGAATYDVTEYVKEYPPLPTAGSGSPLCYSAVVKGIKPLSNNNKSSFNPIKDCANATPQRNTSNLNSVSTQMSQWDQMVVERSGKFNKPAPQCIHWNNPKHRLDFPCRFWHPREQCRYYPNCSNTADECGFAHPFCGDFCRCPKGKRDPQKNHRIPEERYFGSGDRMKYTASNGAQ